MAESTPPRPWSSARRPLDVPHVEQFLELSLAVGDKCLYLRCPPVGDLGALARGVAKFLPSPSIWSIGSDRVATDDAVAIVRSLEAGGSVVLARTGASELAVELANEWAQCTRYSDGSTFVYAGFAMRAVETAGTLVVVHVTDAQAVLPRQATVCRVPEHEAATLEILGGASLMRIRQAG